MHDYEFYDYEKVEKLRKEHSEKHMEIVRKWYAAKEKGDAKAMKRWIKALSKHKEENLKLKERAESAGHYWY